MYLYCVVKHARFLPELATNTLEMAGFSTKKNGFFSFQESSAYTHSTHNVTNMLSVKIMNFDGDSWQICHEKGIKRFLSAYKLNFKQLVSNAVNTLSVGILCFKFYGEIPFGNGDPIIWLTFRLKSFGEK